MTFEPEQTPGDPVAGSSAASPLSIVLVHGTWSDGFLTAVADAVRRTLGLRPRPRSEMGRAFWYQMGHGFRGTLEQALRDSGFEPAVYTCLWSGANSFAARAACALGLIQLLPKLPAGRIIFIGHSHGGSAALLALTQLKDPSRIELVTMATPFLRLEPCASTNTVRTALAGWWLVAMTFGMAVAVRWTGASAAQPLSLERLMWIAPATGLGVGLVGRLMERAAEHCQEIGVRFQSIAFRGARLQCIRGMSDEAALSISAGLIAEGAGRLIGVAVGRLLSAAPAWVSGGVLLVLVALLAAVFALPHVPTLVLVLLAVPTLLGVATWSASLMQGLLASELMLTGFRFLGSVESTPDARPDQIEVVTLPATQSTVEGLRHGIYNQQACIDAIVRGIRSWPPLPAPGATAAAAVRP